MVKKAAAIKMLELIENFADEVGLEKRIEVNSNGNVTFNATFNMAIDGYKDEIPFLLFVECSNDPLYVLGYVYIDGDDFNIPLNKLSKALEAVNKANNEGTTGRFTITGDKEKYYQFRVAYDLSSLNLQECPLSLIHDLVGKSQLTFSEYFNDLTNFIK